MHLHHNTHIHLSSSPHTLIHLHKPSYTSTHTPTHLTSAPTPIYLIPSYAFIDPHTHPKPTNPPIFTLHPRTPSQTLIHIHHTPICLALSPTLIYLTPSYTFANPHTPIHPHLPHILVHLRKSSYTSTTHRSTLIYLTPLNTFTNPHTPPTHQSTLLSNSHSPHTPVPLHKPFYTSNTHRST